MTDLILNPPFGMFFRKKGTLFLCQFRDQWQVAFSDLFAFDDLDLAMSYTSLVVRMFDQFVEGKVLDSQLGVLLFSCQVHEKPEKNRSIREAPADYAQLVMAGFDAKGTRKKHKVGETLSRLRVLHEELNAQLYAHPAERPIIQSPGDAANLLTCFIGHLDHEELWVIDLDTRSRVMQLVALYKGSVNSSQVRVAEVFRQAILDNSPALVLAHNHPSGDPSPSPEDVAVTRSIVEAGKLLDITVLDHLVISKNGFVSLKERGLGF